MRSRVPGLPLPQARHSWEITLPAPLTHARRPPLTNARLWLNARRIATDSCPPDRRWLMPAGSPLTQDHRTGADSCPLAAANPSPVDRVHSSRPGVPCLSCCAHRNILIIMSCLVHGDSSGAGGSSCCGHGGHSSRLLPCRGGGGGHWGTLWGPLTPGHAQKKP